MSEESAFFERDGDRYAPLDIARGWWRRDSLHGRAVVGLVGDHASRAHGAEDYLPARFTIDMIRLAPFDTVSVETTLLHESRRLRLVEASLVVGGETYARARMQLMKRGEDAPGQVWSPPAWHVPPPEDVAGPARVRPTSLAETRHVTGGLCVDGPKQAWTRELHRLMRDEPLSPYARVALGADYVSAYAHGADTGIEYMNTDVTLQLHRLPQGEWIGYEVTGHDASGGIAVGHCRLYDTAGPIGFVACTALANRRRS